MVFSLGHQDFVIGVELFDGAGIDAQIILQFHDEFSRSLSIIQGVDVPDEIVIFLDFRQGDISRNKFGL